MTQDISSSSPAAPPKGAGDDTGLDPRRWLAFAVVLVAGFVDLVDSTIVNVALPSVQGDLHANYAQLEWVVAAYVLSFAALLILSGRLGDIYGRKRVFMVGMAGFTAASLLCGLAVSPEMLIAARFAQGAAAGLMVTQILAILRVTFPEHERAKAVALFGGVTGSSAVFGLALGGVIVQWDLFGWEWRTIFLINVPIGIAALVAGATFVHESRSPSRPRLDIVGMVLALAAVVALVYPLTEGRRLGWPGWTFAMVAGAVVLLVAFVAFERRRQAVRGSALIDFGVFRSRPFSVGMAMWWLFWVASGGFFFAWTLFLQAGLGWSPMHAGLTAATLAVGVGIGAGNAPNKLVPKFGRNVLVAGGLVNAVGWLSFAWLAWHYGPNLTSWALIPVHVLSGIGFGLIVAPTLDMLLGQVPGEQAGNASGLLNTIQQIGIALGVALIGVILFTQLDRGSDRGVDAATPGLRSDLATLGLSSQAQDAAVASFGTCVRDRASALDQSAVPASCAAASPDPSAAGAFDRAVARANAENYSYAFSWVLILGGATLVIAGAGFLALPKHPRTVSPL
ncbi:MFS transporter [Dactylosporangium roseum]|uniref:MFS transporter n=1 Tax=Dactylosporangium roseum TaxID=47989 RepID=A0ABY5Z1H6_9ACTN|nr:MFS transporter [Dactylosporangium roseum]UWZ34349.1 MFS transporter [Dactylosporangium roseum]